MIPLAATGLPFAPAFQRMRHRFHIENTRER
jgi:hypothetical protein